jgi:hypothetical protein
MSAMSDKPISKSQDRGLSRHWLLDAVRYILPALVALAGVVVMCLGGESDLEGGAGIISAGLAIYFINWLFRMGTAGDGERAAEQSARDYFSAHGHWPGEDAPDGPLSSDVSRPLASRRASRIQDSRRPRR